MKLSDSEKIVEILGVQGVERDIQLIQTTHRLSIINFWQIPQNSRILEIGCGQGDTTVALACMVGEKGFIYGIDTASPDYGAPFTLGQARERLLKSEIGSRLKMDFETDFLTKEFEANSYDAVVLSHCSWYFQNSNTLRAILRKARQVADLLLFAEWNITPRLPAQLLHQTAVIIQAECECFRESSQSNVRTLFTPLNLVQATKEAGWTISKTASIYSPDLQDGEWETAMTIAEYPGIINSSDTMPDKLKDLLLSRIEMLKENQETLATNKALPLDTFVFSAK